MTETIAPADLCDVLRERAQGRRILVAIAGPPGAGKSTFVETMAASLNRQSPGIADILAMDGYHFDDRVLEARQHRPRKGAPFTFDVGGLKVMLERLRADRGEDIAVPVFDRTIEIARAGAHIIEAGVRIVLVEGNYLLLDDPAWRPLQPLFDVTVMLCVSEAVLFERLESRWIGFGMDRAARREKIEGNDAPNVRLVLGHSRPADYVVDTGG